MKPDISLYPGVRVDKDTKLDYRTENIDQHIENLLFVSTTKITGDGYESVYVTTIHLKEGDTLIFEDGGRGYIKPVEPFVTIEEAIDDLTNIKDLG
jgi:hypothetical protein